MPGVIVCVVVGPVRWFLIVILVPVFFLEVPVAQPEQILRFCTEFAAGIERRQAEGVQENTSSARILKSFRAASHAAAHAAARAAAHAAAHAAARAAACIFSSSIIR